MYVTIYMVKIVGVYKLIMTKSPAIMVHSMHTFYLYI